MGTKTSVELVPTDGSMRDWAEQLVARSRAEGIELTGADGLLTALIRTVLQQSRCRTKDSESVRLKVANPKITDPRLRQRTGRATERF
jgi:hypothetical protein